MLSHKFTKLISGRLLRQTQKKFFALREVTMPAVSPTMTKGNIIEYYYKEKDFIDVGESVANIETDKANVTLDIQEEGYLAKIIEEAGAKDIKVGQLIMYMVDEEEELSQIDQLIKEHLLETGKTYLGWLNCY